MSTNHERGVRESVGDWLDVFLQDPQPAGKYAFMPSQPGSIKKMYHTYDFFYSCSNYGDF